MAKANETHDKIVYWQERQREAMQRISYMLDPYFAHPVTGYYRDGDRAYIKAWQEQHAMAYRQVVRHRGY